MPTEAEAGPNRSGSERPPASRSPLRTIAVVLLAWLAVFSAYRLTDRQIKIIDVQGVIRLPISLWNEGDLDLDEFADSLRRFPGVTFVHDGRAVSAFPFWPAFQLLPAYAILGLLDGEFPDESTVWVAQRRAAQASMALTVVLVGVIVGRRHGWLIGLVVALAFGFGTINWFVLSQLSFSNGLVQLWVAAALAAGLWTVPPSRGGAALSLVLLVIAISFRLNMLAFAAVWGLYLIVKLGRRSLLPVAAAVTVAAAIAAANLAYVGHPLGFYGIISAREGFPSPTLALAVIGNLVSPARGMLVFSPWLVLSAFGLVGRRSRDREAVWVLALGCLAHLLLTSNFSRWHGGGSMGPRLTADLLPVWAVLAGEGLAWCRRRTWTSALAGLTLVVSVVIAAGHAFSDSQRWEFTPVTADVAPDRLFDWRDSLVLAPFRSVPHEAAYSIRLESPPAGTETHADVVAFRWRDPRGAGRRYVVDVVVKHRPRGVRLTRESFEAPAPDHLDLAVASIPSTFDPSQPLAWRVRALDDRGRVVSRSGWRVFSWAPEAASVDPDPQRAAVNGGS